MPGNGFQEDWLHGLPGVFDEAAGLEVPQIHFIFLQDSCDACLLPVITYFTQSSCLFEGRERFRNDID